MHPATITLKSILLLLSLCLVPGGILAASGKPVAFEGEQIQGGLLIAQTVPNASVSVNGKKVRVSDDGVFLVGFSRDDNKPVTVNVVTPEGGKFSETLDIRQRKYAIQRIDGLPQSKVTPDKSVLERIRREGAEISAARKRDDARTDFISGFIWPVEGRLSGFYGSQRILNGVPKQPHYGIDFAAPSGAPVRAPAGGIVTYANPDMYYSGGTLVLDHGHGLSSSFLHLSKLDVKVGDRVEQGDVIAAVGKTGRATGPHLDWRINLFKQRLDPQFVMQPRPEIKDPD